MLCDKTIGSRIVQARDKAKETQEQLADAIGVTRDALAKWETYKRRPKLETLYNIAEHLNVSMDYLLGRQDDPTNEPDMKAMVSYTGLSVQALQNIREYGLYCKSMDHENSIEGIFSNCDPSFRHLVSVLFDSITAASKVQAAEDNNIDFDSDLDSSYDAIYSVEQLRKKGYYLVEPHRYLRMFKQEAISALELIINTMAEAKKAKKPKRK